MYMAQKVVFCYNLSVNRTIFTIVYKHAKWTVNREFWLGLILREKNS